MRTTKLSPSSKPSLVMRARIRRLMSGRLRSDSATASPQVGSAGQAMDVLSMLSRSTTSLQRKCPSQQPIDNAAIARDAYRDGLPSAANYHAGKGEDTSAAENISTHM